MKKLLLCLLLTMPLAACASGPVIRNPVSSSSEAAGKASFCNVARPMPPVSGDPVPTEAMKAGHNAAGARLNCPNFRS